MTRLLIFLATIAAAYHLRRAYRTLRGQLLCIESLCDEAIGRLTVLTAEHSGGYESERFARIPAGAREKLETARAGASDPRLN